MAGGGKGKSSRGRGRGRESTPKAKAFHDKNPIDRGREVGGSSQSSNPNSAMLSVTQSNRSLPSQYPLATRAQKSPTQATQTPTPARSLSQSGSQQPPLIRRKQQQPPARQHQITHLQEQPAQDSPETQFIPNHQNPTNHEEEDEDDGEEDGEEVGEEDGEEVEEEEENPNVDYQELLDRLLALPGRQHLPVLSQEPIPGVDTLW